MSNYGNNYNDSRNRDYYNNNNRGNNEYRNDYENRYSYQPRQNNSNNNFLLIVLALIIVILICIGIAVFAITSSKPANKIEAPHTPAPTETTTEMPEATEAIATEEPEETEAPTPVPTPQPTPETVSTPKPAPAPVFNLVSSSSDREPFKTSTTTYTYPVTNAFDNNSTTVWSPGISDSNPWIRISSNSAQSVSGLEIENGYSKNSKSYYNNNRAKDISVTCNGKTYYYTLADKGPGVKQKISFNETIVTNSITINFISEYYGSKYDDLCITQISPY